MNKCSICGAPVDLAPDGDPHYDSRTIAAKIALKDREIARLRALLDAIPPETLEMIRAGMWVVVPKAPTNLMIDRAFDCQEAASTPIIKDIYDAMLDASPRKPEG